MSYSRIKIMENIAKLITLLIIFLHLKRGKEI